MLPCTHLHLINSDEGCLALHVGSSFSLSPISDGVEIFITDLTQSYDLSNYYLKSQIRKNYANFESSVMAEFSFTDFTYGQKLDENGDPVTVDGTVGGAPLNGWSSTMSLPVTEADKLITTLDFPTITNVAKQLQKMLDNGDITVGVNAWVYEVKLINPTGLLQGIYPIIKPSLVQVVDQSTVIL